MDETQLKLILEALLLSHQGPLTLEKMSQVFEEDEKPSIEQLKTILNLLKTDYMLRAFDLVEVAGGYILQSKRQFKDWIARLQVERPTKYSRALLETLAIIAYKQPVTRGDIENIRGVAVNAAIIKTLMERDWIQVLGHKDVPGKPAIFCTTKEFLTYFNLKHLSELPSIATLEDAFSHPIEEECPTS